jgi:peroxiredoxin
MAMTDLQRLWRTRPLIIVVFFAVPGFLMLLHTWGYLPGGIATDTTPIHTRAVLAPDFSLPDADGNLRRLSSFRGRVVLLNFWATWCPPCRSEMPSLEALYQAYKHQGFEVLAVASDAQGVDVVQPFVAQHRLTFPTLLDTTTHVTRVYGVTTLPTTYVLDREGRLVSVEIGRRDWTEAEARALIASLLDGSRPAAGPQEAEPAHGEASGGVQRMAAGQRPY